MSKSSSSAGARIAGACVIIFAILSLGLILAALALRGSLPASTGTLVLAGLQAPVSIERDKLGRPVITGGSLADLAHGLGFVHAQDRYFQMDMARRSAAGELSAMLGEGTLPLDRARRMHRLRSLAEARLESLPPNELALIEAYTRGVNAGLAALGVRPFEYWLLGERPDPWREADLLLVVYAMFFQLTDETAERDAMMTALRDTYPSGFFDFLTQDGTPWDAPLQGSIRVPLGVPGPKVYSLPDSVPVQAYNHRRRPPGPAPLSGSNNWALHGSRTANGAALLANDMHLGLSLPNTWYFARLVLTDPDGGEPLMDVTGVTLPGTFGVIVGSNGAVAWGFTNSYGDWSERVLVETEPGNAKRYRAGAGFEPFIEHLERIAVKGAPDTLETYRWTRWGPVLDTDAKGRLHALKWLAHEPEAVNTKIVRLAQADSVTEALRLANEVGAPPQNFVVADRRGNIGWTIMGRIPRRGDHDPRIASKWAQPGYGWQGWLAPDEYPRIFNPPGGQLWTANARVAEGGALQKLGDGGYDLGARAGQIRDRLRLVQGGTEAEMLAIQLDDRALFLARWRERLLALLDEDALAGHPQRAELRALVADWSGRAAVSDAGFRLLRAWRAFLQDDVFAALCAEARAANPSLRFFNRQWEGALWQLLEERPAHLLPAQFASWRDWQLHVLDDTIKYFNENYPGPLSKRHWGERNRVTVGHPLAPYLPLVGHWLNMPTAPLPGDNHMPRVQSPAEGASQRLAVAPGNEVDGYFHMPGGQSGHPLSPWYRAGHAAWTSGEPLPFLPGPAVTRLELLPEK